MCCCECLLCLCKCCFDASYLIINPKNFLADKISEIIKERPITSLEMDTTKNPLGKNWSSLSTNERKNIQEICKNKILEALQTIEKNDYENKNILKEFTDRDMNKMINFIGHQINYNLKCCIFNYFKKNTDKTKYKYTKIATPKKKWNDDYENITLPSTKDLFKCDYTEEFLTIFLILQNKKTGVIYKYSRVVESPAEYEKLHEKYFNIVKTVCENNTDYKQIILDSFKYIDNQNEIYNNEKEKIKDFH